MCINFELEISFALDMKKLYTYLIKQILTFQNSEKIHPVVYKYQKILQHFFLK